MKVDIDASSLRLLVARYADALVDLQRAQQVVREVTYELEQYGQAAEKLAKSVVVPTNKEL